MPQPHIKVMGSVRRITIVGRELNYRPVLKVGRQDGFISMERYFERTGLKSFQYKGFLWSRISQQGKRHVSWCGEDNLVIALFVPALIFNHDTFRKPGYRSNSR